MKNESEYLFEMVVKITPWNLYTARKVVEDFLEQYPNETCLKCKLVHIIANLGYQYEEAEERVEYWLPKLMDEAKDNVKNSIDVLMGNINDSGYVIGCGAMAQALVLLTEYSLDYCGKDNTLQSLADAFNYMKVEE